MEAYLEVVEVGNKVGDLLAYWDVVETTRNSRSKSVLVRVQMVPSVSRRKDQDGVMMRSWWVQEIKNVCSF